MGEKQEKEKRECGALQNLAASPDVGKNAFERPRLTRLGRETRRLKGKPPQQTKTGAKEMCQCEFERQGLWKV
jgi:hypothetical protein